MAYTACKCAERWAGQFLVKMYFNLHSKSAQHLRELPSEVDCSVAHRIWSSKFLPDLTKVSSPDNFALLI